VSGGGEKAGPLAGARFGGGPRLCQPLTRTIERGAGKA
jgi:hypothetical protein